MNPHCKLFFLVLLTITGFHGVRKAEAIPTKIVVRAKAKDAKFIGSSIGGALVLIHNAETGELLAKGFTIGSSGNTDLIMGTPRKRNMRISDPLTAKFETYLDIEEPILLKIIARAPANKKDAQIEASTEIWLIPGKPIEKEGIILTFPGYIVDIVSPITHQFLDVQNLPDGKIHLKANIIMLCGSTISKGGIWDSDKMEVEAIVKIDGQRKGVIPLHILDTNNLFEGFLEVSESGNYEIIVTAYQAFACNTGMSKVNFVVQ